MSQSQWSKLERGALAKTSWLPQIAHQYGISAVWLAYGTEPRHIVRKLSPQSAADMELLARHAPILAERAGGLPPKQLRALARIIDAICTKKLSDDDVAALEQIVRRFTGE